MLRVVALNVELHEVVLGLVTQLQVAVGQAVGLAGDVVEFNVVYESAFVKT